VLQPNIQERDFARYAPYLEDLDLSTVRMFYHDLCRVAHDHGIYVPAYEEHRPEATFSRIECGDTRTASVPKFCQSNVQRWEAIIHHHLKRDKVIPSTHPQASEIKHNPNGYEALMLLICPYCQPRGQCVSVDDRGASSECKPLIYCSHNSHSLFSYTVILARLELTMGFYCRS